MSQQSLGEFGGISQGSVNLNSQETFQNLWNLFGDQHPDTFTHINVPETRYEYTDEALNTEVSVNKLFVNLPGHQDTISELFGSQALQNAITNPVSPDSQSGMENGQPPSPMHYSPTLPSNTNYPGPYGFEMTLGAPPKETKSTTWTYSLPLNKLFARMAVSCPFKFKCASPPPAQCGVRAMAIYAKPEHVTDVVKRCPNHTQSRDYLKDGVPQTHFVRCDNPNAIYNEEESGRHSVIVPLELLDAGDEWQTFLFQFMCNNSCAGGINRRSVQVVFTLESSQREVLGRQVLEVRICACPGRDRKDSEKAMLPPTKPKKPLPNKVTATTELYAMGPVAKRRRIEEEEVFTLTVRGRENYEMLMKIRDSLELTASLTPTQMHDFRSKQQSFHKQFSFQRTPSISSQQQVPAPQPQPQLPVPTVPHQQQQPSVPLSQGFNFSPSLSQEAYRLPMLSSQPTFLFRNQEVGMEETDGGAPVISSSQAAVKTEPDVITTTTCQAAPVAENAVKDWLKKIGMSAYVDNFHSAGYQQMFHLDKDRFSMEDLNKMKIGTGHRNKIWKSLLEYREEAANSSKQSQDVLASASRASTLSMLSQNSGFSPGFYEVTKYTFRQTLTMKRDHDYCSKETSQGTSVA